MSGIIFYLRLEGKKRIRMSCFSVTDPFLTTFYYVEKLNEILRKNRGGGLEKSLHTLTLGSRDQTDSYVIFFKSIFYIRNRVVMWFGRDQNISFASGR